MTERDGAGPQDGHDRLLDGLLRNVPVPVDIPDRVTVAALFDDAAIDRLLVDVATPAGLLPRVRKELAGAAATPPITRPAGPDTTVPSRPAGRTRAAVRALRDVLLDGAAAAAALGLVVGMFMAGTVLSRRLAPVRERDEAPRAVPAVASVRPRTESLKRPPAVEPKPGGALIAESSPGDMRPDAQRPAGSAADAVGPDGAAAPARQPAQVRAAPPPDPPDVSTRRSRGPSVRTVLLPEAARRVPRSSAYDLAFEMAYGEAPFVDPRASGLSVDRPPLTLRCDSFDMVLAAGAPAARSPALRPRRDGASAARVEEFLAAVSPPSADDEAAASVRAGVRLSVGTVRSLRASPESVLVELCATALPPAAGPTLDALVVIDQSSGPGTAVAWQWACRGLARVASQMHAGDRVSVIVCAERPRLAALRVDAAGLTRLVEELRREPAAGAADIDAGLRLVADVARREGPPRRTIVLAHAGSLEQCRAEGRVAVAAWQAARAGTVDRAVAERVEFVRIDPQQSGVEGDAAESGGVEFDGVAVARALVAQVFDRPTLVAQACRMEVRLDPDAVGSYRIVGHRQMAADALEDGPAPAIDLHAGETVRVVYEVVRRSRGREPSVKDMVEATLRWTPVGTGGEASARVGLAAARGFEPGRDPASSPHACELLLAMGLGEWLAGSVHAEPRRQFTAAVAGLARACRGGGDLAPPVARLVEGVEQEGILRPEPSGR